MMRKHTILFLAANPSGTDRLALDQEARAIEVELERNRWRDSFELALAAHTKQELQAAFSQALRADGPAPIAVPVQHQIRPLVPGGAA